MCAPPAQRVCADPFPGGSEEVEESAALEQELGEVSRVGCEEVAARPREFDVVPRRFGAGRHGGEEGRVLEDGRDRLVGPCRGDPRGDETA